jgi:multidrug efflux pump
MERLAAETLPNGISADWTELTFQQKLAGNTAVFVFPLCVLLVFLVLAAQYESWSLPLVIILIVEFARDLERQGKDRLTAALEACRIRLRPILMTSFAFIMGVVPLVIANGAGAEMRRVMGIAVFSGMLGVTFFGLLFTPVFYVLIRGLVARRAPHREAPTDDDVRPLRIHERMRGAIGGEGVSHA